jgi:hypothetical protein
MSLGIVKTWNEIFPDYPEPDTQWGIIPQHMRYSVYHYVMDGQPVGDFLTALIEDAAASTVWRRADQTNQAHMHGWMIFLYNYFPSQARGSREAMQAWIDKGGINGKKETMQ